MNSDQGRLTCGAKKIVGNSVEVFNIERIRQVEVGEIAYGIIKFPGFDAVFQRIALTIKDRRCFLDRAPRSFEDINLSALNINFNQATRFQSKRVNRCNFGRPASSRRSRRRIADMRHFVDDA